MNSLTKRLYQHYISRLIKNKCDDRTPRTGDAGRKTNCFLIYLNQNNQPYLLVENIFNNELNCLKYNGNKYQDDITINIEDIDNLEPEIIHYYGLYQITYFGIYDYLLERYTYYLRLKINSIKFLDFISQYLFNRRSLETKQRIDFIRLLAKRFVGVNDGFSYVDVMIAMHSNRSFLHPQYHDETKRVQSYLDGFVDTGELKLINYQYHLTGFAYQAIDTYEEQDRKHKAAIRAQYLIIALTVILAILTAVQAGVIVLPMFNLS